MLLCLLILQQCSCWSPQVDVEFCSDASYWRRSSLVTGVQRPLTLDFQWSPNPFSFLPTLPSFQGAPALQESWEWFPWEIGESFPLWNVTKFWTSQKRPCSHQLPLFQLQGLAQLLLVLHQSEFFSSALGCKKIDFYFHTAHWATARSPLHRQATLLRNSQLQLVISHLWASSSVCFQSAPVPHKRYIWFHSSLSYAAYGTLHISAVLHVASDRQWPYGP